MHRHKTLHCPVDDPWERVEGGNEDIEEGQGGEDGRGSEVVAQQGEEAEGEEGEQQGGGCPEVHAEGIHVLAHCQGLQLLIPCTLHLAMSTGHIIIPQQSSCLMR